MTIYGRGREEVLLLPAARPPSRAIPDDGDGSLAGVSARDRLFGYIDEVRVDGLLAQVQLRVGDQQLTAVITADAVRALQLKRRDDAIAIVKSTEVMIAAPLASKPGRRRSRSG